MSEGYDNLGRPYEVEEIYNCRNEKENGKLILLREPAIKTTNTYWIETVLGVEDHAGADWKRGIITKYRNRFAEWIGNEDDLKNTLFTNFSPETSGVRKSQDYEENLKSGDERIRKILEKLCDLSDRDKKDIVIYTTYDIYDKIIAQDTNAVEDENGIFFNGKSKPKRHCTFEYSGHKFALFEIIHPSVCPRRVFTRAAMKED